MKVDTGGDAMFAINGVDAKSALESAAAAALDKDGLHFLRLPGNQAPPYDGETINLNGYILGSYVSEGLFVIYSKGQLSDIKLNNNSEVW